MSKNKIIITLVANQAYIHNANADDAFLANNEILFSAISDSYLPLLDMVKRLELEGIPLKLSLVLSPAVCTLLEDAQVQKQYIDHLDRSIALGEEELKRTAKNPKQNAQAQKRLTKLKKDKIDFTETYNQRLVPQFKDAAKRRVIELLPTAATYAYLPHYADIQEVLNAQVETGLHSARDFFGTTGEGFYLPHKGWAKELDRTLRSYGLNYTILDARSFLFGSSAPKTGIFAPVRTQRSLVLFAANPALPCAIVEQGGYMHHPLYKNTNRDIGFDRSMEELSSFLGGCPVRVKTGFQYWANGNDSDTEYDEEAALMQAKQDANAFFTAEYAKLCKAQDNLNGTDAIDVYTLPMELLGQRWHEGLAWLEEFIRLVAQSEKAECSFFKENIQDQFSLPKITPYPCSDFRSGFAEPLLDKTNSWMFRYIRKATDRIIDLTDRFPQETGLKARLLNIGTKEVLLSQSSSLARMIQEGQKPEWAEEEFKHNIKSFTVVFDSLASNTVSTEWLTELEKEHQIFPWINYKIFSHKR